MTSLQDMIYKTIQDKRSET